MSRNVGALEVVTPAMLRNSPSISGLFAPTRVGSSPRFALAGAVAITLGAACSNSSTNQVTPPAVLGMTDQMAPYYQDQETSLYKVQMPVALPVRKPSATDMQSLGYVPQGTPYPHEPFLLASDEGLEVHFTFSNLDDQPHTVWLLIDPWNEFVRWNPGMTILEENSFPNFGYDLPFILPGKSRVQGTLTQDDLHEIAIKLASVQNLLATTQMQMSGDDGGGPNNYNVVDPTTLSNHIFNPQNRSNSGDPLYMPWIPPVIAGVTGFDLGMRTMEAANIAVEITIDVRDLNGKRFVAQDSNDATMGPPPQTIGPPGARY